MAFGAKMVLLCLQERLFSYFAEHQKSEYHECGTCHKSNITKLRSVEKKMFNFT